MFITAYILLAVFGLLSVINLAKYLLGLGLNTVEVVLLVFSVFVSAISAGVIWGGLFS